MLAQQQRDEIASVAASSSVPSRGAAAHRGERVRVVALDAVEARPFDRQRQQSSATCSLLGRGLDHATTPARRCRRVARAESRRRLWRRRSPRASLGKPAAIAQEMPAARRARMRLALAAGEQRVASRRSTTSVSNSRHDRRRARAARLVGSEQEPEEAVGRERDQVGQLADRRESACARASPAARGPSTAESRSRRPAPSATGWRRRG